MVNIVGDHATYHRKYDAPLTSDIETAAKPFSGWVRTSPDAKHVAQDGAAAIAAAMTPPGQVATLILPGDTAWDEGSGPAPLPPVPQRARVSEDAVRAAAQALRSGEQALLLLAGPALHEKGLQLAGRIAAKTGAKFLAQTFNRRIERGAGRVPIERIPYPVEQALGVLAGTKHIVLAGSRVPVAFFAYPDKPSLLAPDDTQFVTLARPEEDIVHALEWLADELGATAAAGRACEIRAARAGDRRDHQCADLGAIARRADPRERHRGRRRRLHRARLLSARPAMRASAHLAAEHGRLDRPGHADGDRRRGRRAPTARCSACRPMAAPCTRCSRCGRRRART